MDKELIKIVAKELKENPATVQMAIDHYERFIAGVIREGKLENVRVPSLGLFRVNMKKLRFLTQVRSAPETKIVRRQKPTQ